MKCNPAIPFAVASKKSKSAPFPASYGKWLIDQAATIGIDKKELGRLAGYDDPKGVTMWRLESGHVDRSVKAASAVRGVLIERGLPIPPVPVGLDSWDPSSERPSRPKLDPADETVRRNLVRFREALGPDQFAAASAIDIAYEELRAYELGDKTPTNSMLAKIAKAYGCTPGAFLDSTEELPAFDLERQATFAFHFGGPGTRHLTAEERRQLSEIAANVTERERAEKRKLAQNAPRKRR